MLFYKAGQKVIIADLYNRRKPTIEVVEKVDEKGVFSLIGDKYSLYDPHGWVKGGNTGGYRIIPFCPDAYDRFVKDCERADKLKTIDYLYRHASDEKLDRIIRILEQIGTTGDDDE